jgi:hypothetical protein
MASEGRYLCGMAKSVYLDKQRYGQSVDKLFEEAEQWQKQHPERMVKPERLKELRKASFTESPRLVQYPHGLVQT